MATDATGKKSRVRYSSLEPRCLHLRGGHAEAVEAESVAEALPDQLLAAGTVAAPWMPRAQRSQLVMIE